MKNQYFGDVNDYRKYGLLRALTGRGDLSLAVCWMLTEDDGRGDGSSIGYLRDPARWRRFDPRLFDGLRQAVLHDEARDVRRIERSGLLGDAVFDHDLLPDDAEARRRRIDRTMVIAAGRDLLFLDPDNGLEVRSVPRGRRGSSKYLYWSEVVAAFGAGHSLIVYQHFPRVRRDDFIERLAGEACRRTGPPAVIACRTNRVLFLVLPQRAHESRLKRGIARLAEGWSTQFEITHHVAPTLTSTGCGATS